MPTMGNGKTLTVAMLTGSLLVGALTGCKTQSAEKLIGEARQFQQNGDHKSAVIQLKNALQKNPDDAEARYLLATAYIDLGDAQSAEKELRKALAAGMAPAKVMPKLGAVLFASGQFQKVLDETAVVADAERNAELLSARGNAYLTLGRNSDARQSFEQALNKPASEPYALIGLARLAQLEKDFAQATRLSEQAIAQYPQSLDPWLFQGDMLRAQGMIEPALGAYGEAVKRKPNNVAARVRKAMTAINVKKYEEARADIDAARKAQPNDLTALYALALLDYHKGKNTEARDNLQQVLRAAPNHLPSNLLMGAVQLALGATQQAEQHLKVYVEGDPQNSFARKLLASSMLKNGDATSAMAVLDPALKQKDAQQDAQLLAIAGETFMQTRQYGKATHYFEKASEAAPQAAAIRTALGKSMLAQGDSDLAITELEKAVGLDPKSTQPAIMLVLMHMKKKEYDKALAAVNTMEKEQPDSPIVHNLKGGVLAGKNELQAARTSFEKALALDPDFFPAAANLTQLDMKENKPDAAKKRLEKFVEKNQKHVPAMSTLAMLALAQKNNDEATAWLERASNADPSAVPPALELAKQYMRTGQKQKAQTLVQRLQVEHAGNPEVLDLLGQVQLANGNNDAALDTYKKLALAIPSSPLAHYRLGVLQFAMKDNAGAAASFRKALSLKADHVDAQLALAIIQAQEGKYAEAIDIARKIQKGHERSQEGYALEGDVLMVQNKPADALKVYEKGFASSKTGPMVIKLHNALERTGKEKEGEQLIIRWLRDQPADSVVRLYAAQLNLRKKQNRAAIQQFEAVLQHDEKNVVALNNLAFAYQIEKDSRALQYAEKAYALAPDNPSIMDTLGWILNEQGQTARALPILQKAAALAPQMMEVRFHLALALFKSGDKAKAKQELEQVLGSGKTFASIDDAKALMKQL